MKKLITLFLILFAFNAKAINFCGSELDIKADLVQKSVNEKLPAFANAIGAVKYVANINNNLPNLPQRDPEMCCSLEVEFTFKTTTLDKGYQLLRAMICSKYGDFTTVPPMRVSAKNTLIWNESSGQVILYQVADKVYLQYYVARSINLTYGAVI